MGKVQAIVLIGCLLFPLAASAADKQTSKALNKIGPLPRDLEIELALSALPPHLRDHATVYVLNPDKGFEVAHKGTNGFYALVARTGDDSFRGSWPLTRYRADILYPISFDSAGAKAQMRVFFDAAEMQAKGTPAEELKKIMQERFKKGYYKAPARAGVSYMLSPILRTYENPDKSDKVYTANLPHVMYYAPNVSNAEIGGTPPSIHIAGYRMIVHGRYPFVIMPGPLGYMIQFLGTKERASITRQYEGMLGRLCELKKVWCLPKEKGQ
ncbi:MAG: hypothetical protein M0Z61_07450 [Nitrospiraceae bacterium]|nr:hypothetical protein [Nitrospiraceae bacterium]